MSISTENSTGSGIGSDRENHELGQSLPQILSVTQELRRALREFPGEAGALGATWATRREAERLATQFCDAARVADVASLVGEYHARVFELQGERWGVVVWYV